MSLDSNEQSLEEQLNALDPDKVSPDLLDQESKAYIEYYQSHLQRHGNPEFARRFALNRVKQEFRSPNQRLVVELSCTRCRGSGKLEHLSEYNEGICYLCGGGGNIYIKTSVFNPDISDTSHANELISQFFISLSESKVIEVFTKDHLKPYDIISKVDLPFLRSLRNKFVPARRGGGQKEEWLTNCQYCHGTGLVRGKPCKFCEGQTL